MNMQIYRNLSEYVNFFRRYETRLIIVYIQLPYDIASPHKREFQICLQKYDLSAHAFLISRCR
jgi:hypothetical protein